MVIKKMMNCFHLSVISPGSGAGKSQNVGTSPKIAMHSYILGRLHCPLLSDTPNTTFFVYLFHHVDYICLKNNSTYSIRCFEATSIKFGSHFMIVCWSAECQALWPLVKGQVQVSQKLNR
jgi:hypothetical protein